MRYSKSTIIIVGLLCTIAAVSCKESSSDSGDSSINGLWKLNSTEGDIAYVHISDTQVGFYDFMGDEYDEGDDCYEIEHNDILEIDGNIYKFEDPDDPAKTINVEVTVDGDQLTVKQPFGSGTVTIRYTKFNGNTNSFAPECIEETTRIQGKITIFQAPF